MIIQRLDRCYEVIRKLGSTSRMAEFLCREQQLREIYLLVRIAEPTLAKRYTLFLEEKIREADFSDYKECFQADGAFYAVFTYSQDMTLADKLAMEDCTRKERAEIARRLLEQILLRNPHPYLMRNALRPDMITVGHSLQVAWNYHLDEVRTFDYCTMKAVCQRLSEVINFLFSEERSGKQYPRLKDYLSTLAAGKISDYLELYSEFMPAYEELCEEGEEGLTQSCLQRLWENIRKIGDKPDSLKDYLRFGKRYVAKKLALVFAFFIVLLLSVFSLLFVVIVYPWIQSRFLTKTMVAHSEDTAEYTGKVRLVEDLESDSVVFLGTLTEGKINGQGMLYDSEGNLRYCGEFLADQYSGMGESYYQNGNVEYAGQFAGGQYEGMGKLYDEAGALIYEGGFSQGLYDGSGMLYIADALLYQGGFSQGLYDGSGMLYIADALLYQGGFSQGLYDGSGMLYIADALLYQGDFSHGLYEGVGVLFYEDGAPSYEGDFLQGMRSGSGRAYDESGELLYEGAFSRDMYEGEGTLYANGEVLSQGSFHMGILTSGFAIYYDELGNRLYQGGIDNGLYDGQGRLYSEGILIYEGGFAEGNYHGIGKEYQKETGRLLYDGLFERGKYSGEGRLYDEKTGELLYEGGFYQGFYDGEGKLYDPVNGYLFYEGGFREGQYDGQGKSYTEGILAYEGEFLLGAYNGKGILYDQITGTAVFEGVFYNGQPRLQPADSEQGED